MQFEQRTSTDTPKARSLLGTIFFRIENGHSAPLSKHPRRRCCFQYRADGACGAPDTRFG